MNAESQSIACIHDAKTKQINRIRKVFASSIKPHHLAPNKTESLRHLIERDMKKQKGVGK